jgi:Family of unknown function (DUF5760)
MAADLKSVMVEWIELKKNIADARKDIQLLSRREKELAEQIKNHMIEQDVEDVKIQDKKIKLRSKVVKTGITRPVIETGLGVYFAGDTVKVETVIKTIIDNAPEKERFTLSLVNGVSR